MIKDYLENYKVVAEFIVSYCPNGKLVQKLSTDPQERAKQKEKIKAFEDKNRACGNNIAEEFVSISNINIYPTFLDFYWKKLSAEERELAINLALKDCCNQEVAGTMNIADDESEIPSAFCLDGDKIYLNSNILYGDKLKPAEILSMLYAIPFEQRKQKYLLAPTPKNILGYENFEHLACAYQFSEINIKNSKKNKQEIKKYLELDSVTNRAYRLAFYDAVEKLFDAIHNLTYIYPKDSMYLDNQIEKMMRLDEKIDETLASGPEDRDILFIKKCNALINEQAIKENRPEDVVSDEDALAHFEYYSEDDHVVDKTHEDLTEDELEEDEEDLEPHFDA